MLKKRATARRSYITNSNLAQIVADNHADAVDRLARIEQALVGIPEKVEKLEAHRNWLAGAVAVLAAIGSYLIHRIF